MAWRATIRILLIKLVRVSRSTTSAAAVVVVVCGVLNDCRRSVHISNFAVVVFLIPFPNGLHNTMINLQVHGRSMKLRSKASLSLCQIPPLEGMVWPMSIRTTWVSVQVRSKGDSIAHMIGAALDGYPFDSPPDSSYVFSFRVCRFLCWCNGGTVQAALSNVLVCYKGITWTFGKGIPSWTERP